MLSKFEKNVLEAADNFAGASISEIASRASISSHRFRYYFRKLRESGHILKLRPLIDISKIGLIEGLLYFSLSGSSAAKKKKFISKLQKFDYIRSIKETGGGYRYCCCIAAKNIYEINKAVKDISSMSEGLINRSNFCLKTSSWEWKRKYLSEKLSSKESYLIYSAPLEDQSLEQFLKISKDLLSALSSNYEITLSDLSRKLKTPISTLEYQKKQLIETRIIKGFRYDIDLNKIGYQAASIHISSIGQNQQSEKNLIEFCQKNPWVLSLNQLIGSWNYVINVEVPSSSLLGEVNDGIYQAFSDSSLVINTIFTYQEILRERLSFI